MSSNSGSLPTGTYTRPCKQSQRPFSCVQRPPSMQTGLNLWFRGRLARLRSGSSCKDSSPSQRQPGQACRTPRKIQRQFRSPRRADAPLGRGSQVSYCCQETLPSSHYMQPGRARPSATGCVERKVQTLVVSGVVSGVTAGVGGRCSGWHRRAA